MSIEELEDQIEKMKGEMDQLEEVCDTLPECSNDDACDTCKTYAKIEKLNEEIGKIEEKIESLMGDDDNDDDDE